MAALRCQNLGKLDQNQPWPASELRAAITLAKAHALRRDSTARLAGSERAVLGSTQGVLHVHDVEQAAVVVGQEVVQHLRARTHAAQNMDVPDSLPEH